jgi:hypothetical protein
MLVAPQCLFRREFDADALMKAQPPRFRHANKRLVYELACPPSGPPDEAAARLVYTRWASLPLPEECLLTPCELVVLPEVYDYAPAAATVWHVNFADPQLFVAYGSPLLAQDELQVLEHPVLGSLRETLLAEKLPALTEEHGAATPILITGVPRRCALELAPDPEAGRPRGLYGNRFARESAQVVRSALRVLSPPPLSNLVCMAAPVGGDGRYRGSEIAAILTTAWTAFRAALVESERLAGAAPVEIRTGFWGCGAFGGSRPLMALLQVLAARLAGVRRLVFYTFDQAGIIPLQEGTSALDAALRRGSAGEPLRALLLRIEQRGFQWGVSDGN